MSHSSTADQQGSARPAFLKSLLVVWLLVVFFFAVQNWGDITAQESTNPDNLTRLHQVESLANGQGWYDLTIDRIGTDGVDMHWSRHVDVIAAPVYLAGDAVSGQQTARVLTLLVVPAIFLLIALWAVGGTAAALSTQPAAPMFAMGLFGATAGNFHFQAGQIDHHGLHVALVVLVLYFFVASTWRWSSAAAGALIGLSLTSSLETVPILASIMGAVGLLWLFDHRMRRAEFTEFGLATVASILVSGALFAPASRLVSDACDVFSLPYLGLFAIPALGLAAVGGRDWTRPQRLLALAGIGGAGLAWFAAFGLECARGPYGDVPDVLQAEWLLRIQEITPLLKQLPGDFAATGVALVSFMAGLIALAVRAKRNKNVDDIVLFVTLAVASILAFWQIRGIPLAQAVAAPVTGGLIAIIHNRVANGHTARLYRIIATVAIVLFPFSAFLDFAPLDEPATCQSTVDTSLEPGRVIADMTLSSELLLITEHDVTASAYHRGWEGVLDVYEIFTADADTAQGLVAEANGDYVATCEKESFVQLWGNNNPGSLADDLANDKIPDWLTPIDNPNPDATVTFYAVSP